MEKRIDEMQKLVSSCFIEIADHAMQLEVLSPEIKRLKDNLKKISSQIEELKAEQTLAKATGGDPFFTRSSISGDEKQDMIKVAYALSRFDYYLFNEILETHHNQTKVIELLAKKLRFKHNTLKNYRDMFDPYVHQENSNRKGWTTRQLPPEFKSLKALWDKKDESSIRAEIEKIIL